MFHRDVVLKIHCTVVNHIASFTTVVLSKRPVQEFSPQPLASSEIEMPGGWFGMQEIPTPGRVFKHSQ